MRLIKISLLSDFRGLKKGFTITFPKSKQHSKLLEPYCLVGLNGSGKSNLLELISEIFFYLEKFSKSKRVELKKFATEFGFEIEYSLPRITYQMQQRTADHDTWTDEDPIIFIKKLPNETPSIISNLDGREYISQDPEKIQKDLVFPQHIIGYSSGMNELISNAFIKMDFHYLEEFNKLTSDDMSVGSLNVNRMFFMDYDANKLITICNFIFDEDTDESRKLFPLKNELGIESLHSFSIDIHLRDVYGKTIKLPSELNIALEALISCSTTKLKTVHPKKDDSTIEYKLDYYIDKETKKAFRYYFKTPVELYKKLYFFRLLNLHLIGKDTHFKIKNADSGINLSALLPKHEEKKLIFNVSNIALKKRNIVKPIYYKQLSDGEHQFLHVLGAVILMDMPGTLFILDEPETHFNPEWRSKFISMLNMCLENETDYREQEVFLTTHSPFLVSDCKQEKVFIFNRDINHKVVYNQPDFQTYGTSIEMIYWKIFGKHETISSTALHELEVIKKKIIDKEISKKEAILELLKFGDSLERMKIVNLLKEQET